MLLTLVAIALSLIPSVNHSFVLGCFVEQFKCLFALVILSNNILDRREIVIVMWALMAALLMGATSVLTGWSPPGASKAAMSSSRLGGMFVHPNDASDFLAPLLVLCGTLIFYISGRPFMKTAFTVTMVVGLWALLRTGSRGGWLCFAFGFALLLCFALKDFRKISMLTLAVVPIACLIGFFLAANTISSRFDAAGGALADAGRTPLKKQAWAIIADHPLLGVGAGNYECVMYNYELPGGHWYYVVHNEYLRCFAETGAVGFLALLWLLYAWAVSALKCAFSADGFIRMVGVGWLCFAVAQALHWYVESMPPQKGVFIALMLAVLAVAEQYVRSSRGVTGQLSRA
jgi:O-antigen ligase